MLNPLSESMTQVQTATGFTVRVWRKEESLAAAIAGAERNAIVEAVRTNDANPQTIVEAVTALGDIEAVEVLDRFKNGVVHYPDWQ